MDDGGNLEENWEGLKNENLWFFREDEEEEDNEVEDAEAKEAEEKEEEDTDANDTDSSSHSGISVIGGITTSALRGGCASVKKSD